MLRDVALPPTELGIATARSPLSILSDFLQTLRERNGASLAILSNGEAADVAAPGPLAERLPSGLTEALSRGALRGALLCASLEKAAELSWRSVDGFASSESAPAVGRFGSAERAGIRAVSQIRPRARTRMENAPSAAAGKARACIVGGAGALGTLLATALFHNGTDVVLFSRGARAQQLSPLVRGARLVGSERTLTARSADLSCVADRPALLSDLFDIRVDAAAVLRDRSISALCREDLAACLAAKLETARQGDDLATPLRSVLLMNSIAAMLGSPGQASYAAAGAALASNAIRRRFAGIPTGDVAWGAWSMTGLAANDPKVVATLARVGMGGISPSDGVGAALAALALAAGSWVLKEPAHAVAVVNWKKAAEAGGAGPFYERVVTLPADPATADVAVKTGPVVFSSQARITPAMRDAPEGERADDADLASNRADLRTSALQFVLAAVESVVGSAVDVDAPLQASGVDSLGVSDLTRRVEEWLAGPKLSPTAMFDHPTSRALAEHIAALKTRTLTRQERAERAAKPRAPARHESELGVIVTLRQTAAVAEEKKTVESLGTAGSRLVEQPELDDERNRYVRSHDPHLPPGCYCYPTLSQLRRLSPLQRKHVPRLVLGKRDVAEVVFLMPVDLTHVDLGAGGLDRRRTVSNPNEGTDFAPQIPAANGKTPFRALFAFQKGKASIRATDGGRIPGLDRPAAISFFGLVATADRAAALREKLERASESMHGTFLHYDGSQGVWMVKVDGF